MGSQFPQLLNVGCGATCHPAWTNIDLVSGSPDVIAHDLRKGLPYPDQCFDACYSSHVLEHLEQEESERLLRECWRILKPGGVIRLSVPDLEAIVRAYLKALDEVALGNTQREADYDWMMLELFDQMVRSRPGGKMADRLSSQWIPNKDFIVSRIGLAAEHYWRGNAPGDEKSVFNRLREKNMPWFMTRVRNDIARILARLVAGKKAFQAFDEGLFRHSGEIHKWMYDHYSLNRLLTRHGFVETAVCKAGVSRIPSYNGYELDVVRGRVRKPDSLFMEAIRP